MQKLHLVGVTDDLAGLVFSARRGAKSGSYVVPLDASLLKEIAEAERARDGGGEHRLASPRLVRPESALSPREMQDRIRSGWSIDEVAAEAGVDVDWVSRFASPVLAEVRRVVGRARTAVFDKPRFGLSAQPLGASVRRNVLERGVHLSDSELDDAWSAFQLDDRTWVVRFVYSSRGRLQEAEWVFDVEDGHLASRNRLGAQLGHVAGRARRVGTAGPRHADAAGSAARRPAPTRRTKAGTTRRAQGAEAPVKKAAAKKAAAKKAAAKKAAAKKAATEKAAAKRAAAEKATVKKAAAAKKKAVAKKAAANRAAVKKAAAKKAAAKKAAAKKATAKKATAKKTTAKKATAKRTTAKKVAAKRSAAKKAAPRRAGAKKAGARRPGPKKAPAAKAPAPPRPTSVGSRPQPARSASPVPSRRAAAAPAVDVARTAGSRAADAPWRPSPPAVRSTPPPGMPPRPAASAVQAWQPPPEQPRSRPVPSEPARPSQPPPERSAPPPRPVAAAPAPARPSRPMGPLTPPGPTPVPDEIREKVAAPLGEVPPPRPGPAEVDHEAGVARIDSRRTSDSGGVAPTTRQPVFRSDLARAGGLPPAQPADSRRPRRREPLRAR